MQQTLKLESHHLMHLLQEGFTQTEIEDWMREGLCSMTSEEAMAHNFYVVNKQGEDIIKETDSGLYFPFTETFGQIRLDTPVKRDNGKPAKYLTPVKASSQAYIPEGCVAVTEGIKDARMGYLRGGIPVGAMAGVSHYRATLPKGCGYVIIFDSDGWVNPMVMLNLVNAGIWCEGRIQLLPKMEDHPKGGICEYFQAGYTASEFKQLLINAMTPKELMFAWSERLTDVKGDRLGDAIKYLGKLAVELGFTEHERKTLIFNAKKVRKGGELRQHIRNYSKNLNLEETPVEWEAPLSYNQTIGFWMERQGQQKWVPFCNFDFVIQSELESDEGGGLVLQVLPQFSSKEYRVIVDSKGLRGPTEFKEALQRQLGFQVQVALKPVEFAALLADRQYKYRITREGNTKRIVPCYGKQDDGTWVFKDIQISAEGEVLSDQEQVWAYSDYISTNDYIPCPVLAEQNGLKGLKSLYGAAEKVLSHNLNSFYLSAGWVLACLNYSTVMEEYGSFPILNLHGDVGTAKSLAMEAAFSLVGVNWADEGIIASGSISAIYERLSKLSCVPLCWDDPPKDNRVDEFAKALWNANPRIVRENMQKPHTSMAFTSNFTIGADQTATWTRLTRLFFTKVPLNKEYPKLRKAMKEASSSFAELVKVKHNQKEIDRWQAGLINRLPYANDRISQSFSIVGYYATELLKLVGKSKKDITDFEEWVLNEVDRQENDSESMGSSLVDYFERLKSLEVEDKVGDWNLQIVYKDDVKHYAVAHRSAWNMVSKEFNPSTYNKKSLQSQVLAVGGTVDGLHRFAKNKIDKNRVPRRCWFIPAEAVDID